MKNYLIPLISYEAHHELLRAVQERAWRRLCLGAEPGSPAGFPLCTQGRLACPEETQRWGSN